MRGFFGDGNVEAVINWDLAETAYVDGMTLNYEEASLVAQGLGSPEIPTESAVALMAIVTSAIENRQRVVEVEPEHTPEVARALMYSLVQFGEAPDKAAPGVLESIRRDVPMVTSKSPAAVHAYAVGTTTTWIEDMATRIHQLDVAVPRLEIEV